MTPQIRQALERICNEHGVTMAAAKGRRRFQAQTAARHACWLYLREQYGWSYPDIARAWGVDHTTVMHAVRKGQSDG